VAVSMVVLGGIASAAVDAKSKPVSTERYAKRVCGVYGGVADALNGFVDAYNRDVTDEDPIQFQTEVVALTEGLLDDLASAQTKLKKSRPDLDDGKKISKLFINALKTVQVDVSDALEAFRAADPTGVAFQADISSFQVAINLLDVNSDDPFRELEDQDLLKAFGDEKSCEDVVTIFGG
jgi:hypothetical protein